MRGQLKEKFLLFRIRTKKDPDAFGAIYDLYATPIYRFIYFKVASAEQAEDLTSDTFLKAWQYLKERHEVRNLQALLYSIARNVVVDHYRSSAVERSANVALTDEEGNIISVPDEQSERLLQTIDTQLDISIVLEQLRGLKDEYREAIIMRYFNDLSTTEIATVLGKSTTNVRVLLHRAIKTLSESLTHEQERTHNNFQSSAK